MFYRYRLRRFFPYALAAVLAAVSLPGYGQSLEEETRAYAQMIGEKHDLLGRSLLIKGRLIEAASLSMVVVNDEEFIDDEEMVERFIDKIGLVEDLESMPLPGDSDDLRDLHGIFVRSVAYLRKCGELFEAAAYYEGSTIGAEAAWSHARKDFMSFTKRLNGMLGNPLIDIGESSQGPEAKIRVGERLIKPKGNAPPPGEE